MLGRKVCIFLPIKANVNIKYVAETVGWKEIKQEA
jgi:hypothetical protein